MYKSVGNKKIETASKYSTSVVCLHVFQHSSPVGSAIASQ